MDQHRVIGPAHGGLRSVGRRLAARCLPVLGLVAVLALSACGGGGTVPLPQATGNDTGLRPLPAELTGSKAIAYGPYRTARTEAARKPGWRGVLVAGAVGVLAGVGAALWPF